MDLDSIIKNISVEDKFEHTVDVLIAETEGDEKSYSDIMNACINLSGIMNKAPRDEDFLSLVEVLSQSALERMTELRKNVECSLNLNDILYSSEFAKKEHIKAKVDMLYELNCKMYNLCLSCEDYLKNNIYSG